MNASFLLRSFVLASVGALAVACGGESSGSTTTGDTKAQLADDSAESCTIPPSVPPPPDLDGGESPPPGCTGSAPAGQICNQGDGTCTSLCGSGTYEMTCTSGGSGSGGGASIPQPDSSLGCTILRIPTPSTSLYYCCACE